MSIKLMAALSLVCFATSAQQPVRDEPRYTSDGRLMKPENYREWIFLSSGLGMTYGVAAPANPSALRFDNVFVTPQAYKAFLQTGKWPDKTMFALEVRNSSTAGSINKGGHYQEGVSALEFHVKDEARFPTKWAFFGFGNSDQTGKAQPANSACQKCHSQHGAVDETFVQFYPTLLPIAKAKGTLKPEAVR
jgi:hypothetical protein